MSNTQVKVARRQVLVVDSYQKVFRGPDGERVLYDLMSKHWILSSTKVQDTDPYELAFREGERNVVLRIMSLLKVNPEQLRERVDAYVKEME